MLNNDVYESHFRTKIIKLNSTKMLLSSRLQQDRLKFGQNSPDYDFHQDSWQFPEYQLHFQPSKSSIRIVFPTEYQFLS